MVTIYLAIHVSGLILSMGDVGVYRYTSLAMAHDI